MSEKFNPESDYDPDNLAALIDVQCDALNCYGECEVGIAQRYNKVKVWCVKCDRDLGMVARRAHKIPNDAPLMVRPPVNVTGAALEHSDEYLRALAAAESPHHQVFVIGDTFSVVQTDGTVSELNPTALRIRLSEVVQSRNKQGWSDPPVSMVGAIMESAADQQSIPKLERVNTVPVFMADGRVLDTPGYDSQSHTYYAPIVQGIQVPETVTESDVAAAVELLTVDYLGDIAFKTQADRANAIAVMLLPFVRTLVGPTPLHVFDAPGPGHGKSQTLTASLLPGCGEVQPTSWPHSSAEQTKSLLSALRKAPNAIFLDNVTGTVQSESLELILTSPWGYWSNRILGESREITVPVHQTWTMSTNNGRMGKSMQRRAVWVRIDAQVEQPMLRKGPTADTQWRHPEGLVEWGKANRAELVSACLVLCKYWMQEGTPSPTIAPTSVRGSYEQWQRVVGGILQSAGITGFCDNAHERDIFNEDHSELAQLLSELFNTFGEGKWFTASDAIKKGLGEDRTARGYGRILGDHVDERAGGLMLCKRYDPAKNAGTYAVVPASSGT